MSRVAGVVCTLLTTLAACSDRAEPVPTVPQPDLSTLAPDAAACVAAGRRRVADARSADAGALSDAWGDLGITYYVCELPVTAEACWSIARATTPTDPRWTHLLGRLAWDRGDLRVAAEEFDRTDELARAVAPVTATSYGMSGSDLSELRAAATLAAGECLLAAGELVGAEARINQASRMAPTAVPVRLAQARLLRAQGRDRDAVAVLRPLGDLVPPSREVEHALAMALRAIGGDAEAKRRLAVERTLGGRVARLPDPVARLVEERRREVQGPMNAGRRLFAAGLFSEAAAAFADAVGRAPGDADALAALGAALERSGHADEAERAFREALRIAPRHPEARFGLGTCCAARGTDDEAVTHYLVALEVDARNWRVSFNLANALGRLGRWGEALPHYRAAVERAPGEPGPRRGLVRMLGLTGDWSVARKIAEDAVARSPDDPDARDDLARVLCACPVAKVRDGRRALVLALRVVRESPSVGARETLAMALAETGDLVGAVRIQRDLVVGAVQAGDAAEEERLRSRLREYDGGRPCREPWPATDLDSAAARGRPTKR